MIMAIKRLFLFLIITAFSFSVSSCKPRCPISSCHVRMVHAHGGEKEYRGQPIYKKQNPKMGEKINPQKGQQL
jgi:hypothetical protein